jgi:hypothetical protein
MASLFFCSLSLISLKLCRNGFHIVWNLLVLLVLLSSLVEGKDQYVQPLSMGMQVAIPYDIGMSIDLHYI